ncbi:MAG: KOW motif-containing protein [Candidatus Hatepunaea meridiana]|nr:KOW motif-containing protein [Candidatus Hatepunaea meridiana]
MSTPKKKIGDRVMITAGQNKDKVGTIVDKERRGWTIELEDGSRVTASFPMVALVEASEQTEQTGGEQQQEAVEAESPIAEAEAPQEADPTAQGEAEPTPETPDGRQDIAKMTVKQLQAQAKQRGIGIARTKSDFLRIIKEKNPDEDLDQLTGKTLFNRVTELHISRLRTKNDLVQLLTV